MIKKCVLFSVIGLLWAVSVCAADLKIGYVDLQLVLDKSPQGERATQSLEKEFSSRRKRLEMSQNKLKRLEEEFSRDAAIMSDAQKDRKQKQIITERRELKRSQEEFLEDLNFRRNDELGKLQKEVIEAIKALAREDNYDILLSNVVYASDSVNVTSKVLDKLKAGYRGR